MASAGKKAVGIKFVLPAAAEPAMTHAGEDVALAQPAAPVPAPAAAPVTAAPASVPAVAASPGYHTGLGRVNSLIGDAHAKQRRIDELEGEVAQLEKERGAQPIDARDIVASRWANRHRDSFKTPEFEALKAEIQDAGGNVQPIKVRPRNEVQAGEPHYEVVFGHRRHQACLELGLPVLAVVEPLSDEALFTQMERENRLRAGLSAYEQGAMYLRALNEGLFPSRRKLAEAIGRSVSDVVRAMQIAELPGEVITAFATPNEIQFRWATTLSAALAHDKAAVLSAAAQCRDSGRPAGQVHELLTACLPADGDRRSTAPKRSLDLGNGRQAALHTDGAGNTVLKMTPGMLPAEKWDAFEKVLRKFFA